MAALVACKKCGDQMRVAETVQAPNNGPTIEMYECSCSRKAALVYEPEGGIDADQNNWVEREISMRGSFFPSDYTGGGPRR